MSIELMALLDMDTQESPPNLFDFIPPEGNDIGSGQAHRRELVLAPATARILLEFLNLVAGAAQIDSEVIEVFRVGYSDRG